MRFGLLSRRRRNAQREALDSITHAWRADVRVRVDLRSLYAFVPQQRLHGADIHTITQELLRIGVAKFVRGDHTIEPDLFRGTRDCGLQ